MSEFNPCLDCGACCSAYLVNFYWAETTAAPGGMVPVELTNSRSPLTRCMQGTDSASPRCVALEGEVGRSVACRIYPQRPSPCHAVRPGDDFCLRARARHGLPPPQTWVPPRAA